MKKKFISLALLVLAAFPSAVSAVDYTPKYQLINNPNYPTNDLAVATYNLMDFGVDNTGKTDCTNTINTLLKKLSGIGTFETVGNSNIDYKYKTGGILYIPEGVYCVKGQIVVPRGVTIRGDWKKPEGTGELKGTVIKMQPSQNKNGNFTGLTAGDGSFVMCPTSEMSNLTFWYPDQSLDNVVAYPPTIMMGKDGYFGNDYQSVRHCTFVNSYVGVKFSEKNGGGCPNIFDVYGTPLSQGICIDNLADVGRFDWLSFSPKYWANSELEGAPSEAAVRAYIKANATAFVMRRNDWSYTCNLTVDGYKVGFSAEESPVEGRPNGHNYGFYINDCQTGVEINYCSGSGIMFTNVNTTNCGTGVHYKAGLGPVQFLGCNIQGDMGLVTELSGGVGLLVQQCDIKGNSFLQGTQFTSINCNYDGDVNIGPMARPIFTGNTVRNGKYNNNSLYECVYDEAKVPVKDVPVYKQEWMDIKTTRPGRAALYVVTDPEFGAVPVKFYNDPSTSKDLTGEDFNDITKQPDNSAAIQKALDKAAAEGGGIVYLPAGHYRMDKGLRIPNGVELKGAGDIGSVPKGNGSILEVYGVNEGNENADAFVMMEEGSGIRGVHFNYPNQKDINNVIKYPYTIRGNKNCYVVNVAARTAYRILDLFTNKCDNHYVDYLAGHAYMNVVRVGGGSENGIISNIQCNTIAHACGDETKFGCWLNAQACKDKTVQEWVYGQNYEELDFFIVGDCTNEFLYNNFLFGCHEGMRFQKDNGKGAKNCYSLGNAVDGAVNTVVVNGIDTDLDLTNSQIVALNNDKDANIRPGWNAQDAHFFTTGSGCDKSVNLFSSNLWGGGKYMCDVQGGTVNMYLTNMAASGATYTFNVANNANMNVVGGYIQQVKKLTNNATTSARTKIYSSVFDLTGKTGTFAADNNNLRMKWTFASSSMSNMLPRSGWVATSNENNGNAYRVLDNNLDTRWDTGDSQKNSEGTWLNVNMKNNQTFNAVLLDAAGSSSDGPAVYKVELYRNGAYEEVQTGVNGGAQTVILFDQPVTASQVRITLLSNTKGNYWSVHEFYLANINYVPTAIEDVIADSNVVEGNSAVEIFTINGMKVAVTSAEDMREATSLLNSGIYIIRYKNGVTRKIVVR